MGFRGFFLAVASVLSIFVQPLYGWYNTGHMLVANIAYQQLTPSTKKAVDPLLGVIGQYYPHGNTFVTSSTWADDVRGAGKFYLFNSLHYTEIPYDPEGVLSKAQHNEIKARTKNNDIVWLIEEAVKVLKNPHSNIFEKSLMLRLMIHAVADLHQPLHAVTRYTKKLPQGDKGGNGFGIKGKSVNNLHAFWDSGCGRFLPVANPPSPIALQSIKLQSLDLVKKYPLKSYSNASVLDPKIWAKESFQYAHSYVYTLPVNSVPSKKYVMRGRHLCERQITLAGYRLAKLLNSIHILNQ